MKSILRLINENEKLIFIIEEIRDIIYDEFHNVSDEHKINAIKFLLKSEGWDDKYHGTE